MRLISVVAEELWLCQNNTVSIYKGDIASYKRELREGLFKQNLIVGDEVGVYEDEGDDE